MGAFEILLLNIRHQIGSKSYKNSREITNLRTPMWLKTINSLYKMGLQIALPQIQGGHVDYMK